MWLKKKYEMKNKSKKRSKLLRNGKLAVILHPQIVALRLKTINKQLKTKHQKMIIVPVKEGENIERALKKFKRKYERTGIVKELRARQQFNKPSVLKRLKMEHAIYVQKMRDREEM